MTVMSKRLATPYRLAGWWGEDAVGDLVAAHSARQPDRAAFTVDEVPTTMEAS